MAKADGGAAVRPLRVDVPAVCTQVPADHPGRAAGGDGQPVQQRLASALLIGDNLLVPTGTDMGGALPTLPVCRTGTRAHGQHGGLFQLPQHLAAARGSQPSNIPGDIVVHDRTLDD